MHLVSQACSWSWHSSEGCCPDLQGIDAKTRYRSKRLEAGVPEHGCAPTWSWTISCHVHSCQQVVVNKNVFMEYAHRVPFHQFNGISIKGGVHLSYLSIQVRLCAQHSSPGAGCGAPSPVWVLLCEPKSAGQSRLQVVLSTHSGCPSLSSCVAVSVWDTRSGSWTSRFLVSVTLYHPPGEEALCFSKEPGIKLNPTQIPGSAIFIGCGILDERLHLSQT